MLPLSLLYHPGVWDCHVSIHFLQRQINVPIIQGQANERFLVKEAGLTDDRKADGRVSWQGLLGRGGRVACWEAEPNWDSGCLWSRPQEQSWEGKFYCLVALGTSGCKGGNTRKLFLTSIL